MDPDSSNKTPAAADDNLVEATAVEVVEGTSVKVSWRDVVDNRKLLIALLFFATAGLGIPLIWLSRVFSPKAKLILTITVSIYTVVILWLFWRIMQWCYDRIAPVMGW